MIDVREDILARLLEVVTTIPNIRTAQRNDMDLDETELPGVIVLDGDEETDDVGNPSQQQYRPIVRMMPRIVLAQQADEVGSDLTTLRRELIKRVLYDSVLIAKTGSNGAIRYLGCTTDFGWMRWLQGSLEAQF